MVRARRSEVCFPDTLQSFPIWISYKAVAAKQPGNQMPSLHLNAGKQLPWHFSLTLSVRLSLSSLPEIKQQM